MKKNKKGKVAGKKVAPAAGDQLSQLKKKYPKRASRMPKAPAA